MLCAMQHWPSWLGIAWPGRIWPLFVHLFRINCAHKSKEENCIYCALPELLDDRLLNNPQQIRSINGRLCARPRKHSAGRWAKAVKAMKAQRCRPIMASTYLVPMDRQMQCTFFKPCVVAYTCVMRWKRLWPAMCTFYDIFDVISCKIIYMLAQRRDAKERRILHYTSIDHDHTITITISLLHSAILFFFKLIVFV